MDRDRLLNLIALPLPQKLAILLAATVVYALLFAGLYPIVNIGIAPLSVFPIILSAWLLGIGPALLVALMVIGLNVALILAFSGDMSATLARYGNATGVVVLLGIGAIIGTLRDLSLRLRAESRQRADSERALVEERTLAEALRMTANNLNSTLDLEELMQRILNNVWRVVPHDAANIMLIEGATARVVGRRGYRERGLDETVLDHRIIIKNMPSFQRMIDTGQPTLIANTGSNPDWVAQPHTRWIKSFLSAPIRIDGKVAGAINLDSMTPDFFTGADAQRLGAFADQAAIAINNARLHRLTEERVNRLQLVSDISQQTTAILGLDQLLAESAQALNDAFGYYNALIMLVDDADLVTRAASHTGMHPITDLPRIRIGEQGITGWVAAHGEPLLAPDVKADARYFFFEKTAETRSELAVPIRLRDLTIGVLDVQSERLNAFNDTDITTLQTIADQLAVSIENARLVERIQRRERYVEAIRQVERSAAPERDPQRYLQAIASNLRREFNYSRVVILLGNDEERALSIGAVADANSAELSEQERAYRQRYEVGIMGRVMISGKPYLARDTASDPYFIPPPSKWSIASELVAPIRRRGKTIGVLGVQSTRKDNFDDLDLAVMAEIGEQLGINLENVELNDALRRHADELEERVAERTAELQAAKERLQALDKMKSKFVADVSHELRIPVTNLGLYIDLLEQGSKDKKSGYIRTLREQISRLATLIESILNLSRLELGRARVAFEPVNLNALIEPVVEAFEASADESGLRLTFAPDQKLPEVMGEPSQLTQVIGNLLSNAIRYTRQGEIAIETAVDKERWQAILTVRDTGAGIEVEDQPHVFERFYRGKGAAQSDIPGTGLGLAIIKEIVDLHGGAVELESTPGQGSTVRVKLPMGKLG